MPKSKKTDSEYDVGYRKPPKSTRFKKGESGNRKGRPKKKDHTFEDLVVKIGSEKRKILIGGQETSISSTEAIVRSLFAHANKGKKWAFEMLLDYLPINEVDEPDNPFAVELMAMLAEEGGEEPMK